MMGITMSEAADQSGLGVVVDKVMDGLPASKAGLHMGDKILEVNGTEVEDVLSFREFLSERKAGEEITLKVLRDTTPRDVKVTLEAFSEEALKPLMKDLEANAPRRSPRPPHATMRRRSPSRKPWSHSKLPRCPTRPAAVPWKRCERLSRILAPAEKRHEGAWVTAPNRRLYREGPAGQLRGHAGSRPYRAARCRPRRRTRREDRTPDPGLEKALAMIENQQGNASPETVDKVKAQLLKLQQENGAFHKKVEELQTKRGGN